MDGLLLLSLVIYGHIYVCVCFILLRKDLFSFYAEYTESASYNMDDDEKKVIKKRKIEETEDGQKKIERKFVIRFIEMHTKYVNHMLQWYHRSG